MKIFEILTEAPKGLPPTIKPIKVPAFPEMPQQDGELGAGSQAGPTKDGGKYLSGSQGKFIWDTQGNPSKWQAPNFGGMSQTVDMKTGDITVILQQGGLNVSGVYDKTGKIKQGQGQASYDMGIAKASTGPQGNSITVRGGSPEQDQIVKMGETATAGSTSSGSMATVANPISANAKIKRDKNGVPMAPQKKNADGTAKNALELGNNLMGGATVKR
jgi:hypothetical protein